MAAFGMPGFGGGVGGMMGAARLPQVFDEEYNCYSFAFQVRVVCAVCVHGWTVV